MFLLHLDHPLEADPDHKSVYGHQHFAAFTENLERELEQQQATPSRVTLQLAKKQGISWRLGDAWMDAKRDDLKLLQRAGRHHGYRRICHLCQEEASRTATIDTLRTLPRGRRIWALDTPRRKESWYLTSFSRLIEQNRSTSVEIWDVTYVLSDRFVRVLPSQVSLTDPMAPGRER